MSISIFRPLRQPDYEFNRHGVGFFEALASHFFNQIQKGQLDVSFPSGSQKKFKGNKPGPKASIDLYNLKIVPRMLFLGDLGIAEGYMAGDWDTPDLTSLLELGSLNEKAMGRALKKTWVARCIDLIRHARRANTSEGSRRNIAAHYDIGNDFYRLWLDKTMSYSSALFKSYDEQLEAAQRRKYIRLAEKLELKPGQRVLEIGSGWGSFAEIAATEFKCKVVGLTLSKEQAAFTRARIARLGLTEKVEIRVQDYRDIDERFDKIASIEMFEAVGEAYWPTYFNTLTHCLSPNGCAALQIITIDDNKFITYRKNPEFIQRYIFPGGMLPGQHVLENAVKQAGFKITDIFYFGQSYAETLRRWDDNFQANWTDIENLGFDKQFYRMWHYYLCYCSVGFGQSIIDVGHFLIKPK